MQVGGSSRGIAHTRGIIRPDDRVDDDLYLHLLPYRNDVIEHVGTGRSSRRVAYTRAAGRVVDAVPTELERADKGTHDTSESPRPLFTGVVHPHTSGPERGATSWRRTEFEAFSARARRQRSTLPISGLSLKSVERVTECFETREAADSAQLLG